jgi:hypothetical protein
LNCGVGIATSTANRVHGRSSVDASRHKKWLASFAPGYGCMYLNERRYSHKHPDVWGVVRVGRVLYQVAGWHQYRYGKPQFRLKVREDTEQVEWDGREHEWEEAPDGVHKDG